VHSSIRLSLSLTGTAALALVSITFGDAKAEVANPSEGTAKDLGVMGVSLKDALKPNIRIQGQTQGAGTPNEAGIGGFLPLVVGDNSVFFLDALANVSFSDYSNYSSIVDTIVQGGTISTSSRLGYRWLNSDRSWMFGVNAGYDSRPMATGAADTGVNVRNSSTVFYQQVAAGLEAVSNTWNFNAYALVPVGTSSYQLNNIYRGGALDTYGLDVGYAITPDLNAQLGYYYQHDRIVDGSGLLARLSYNLTPGLTLGLNYSYDVAFESRVSGDIKYLFGGNAYKTQSEKKAWQTPVMQALTDSVKHRDVRVHDNSPKPKYTTTIPITNPGNKGKSTQPKTSRIPGFCAVCKY
jgi:hypothetical protein